MVVSAGGASARIRVCGGATLVALCVCVVWRRREAAPTGLPAAAAAAARGSSGAGAPAAVRSALDLADETNVRVPRDRDGAVLSLAERVRLLELKLGGSTNWAKVRSHVLSKIPMSPTAWAS